MSSHRVKNLNFAEVFVIEIDAFSVEVAEMRFKNTPVDDKPSGNNIMGIPVPYLLIPTVICSVHRAQYCNA
jgi:hypothetical protein